MEVLVHSCLSCLYIYHSKVVHTYLPHSAKVLPHPIHPIKAKGIDKLMTVY